MTTEKEIILNKSYQNTENLSRNSNKFLILTLQKPHLAKFKVGSLFTNYSPTEIINNLHFRIIA